MLLTFLRMLSMFLLGRNRKRKISQESTAAVKTTSFFCGVWEPLIKVDFAF